MANGGVRAVSTMETAVVGSQPALCAVDRCVATARLSCATSMRCILEGDLRGVHPFVSSLVEMLTVGMPDPRDKSAFVDHLAVRTTCVLGDLFSLVRGESMTITDKEIVEEPPVRPNDHETKKEKGDASLWTMLQFPLCVACGALVSQRIICQALIAGYIVHPRVVSRVGLPWCILVFAFLARSLSVNMLVSVMVGLFFVDARVEFPLLKLCIGGGCKSSPHPEPS